MARVRRVDDKREMEQVTEDFLTRGYKVKNEGQRSTMVKNHTWGSGTGHIVVAVLTIWWTLGIGNAVYAIYKNRTAEEVQIKIEDLE
jgi:hypothetical protein